ncbi:hypothetical protein OGAPHI_003063 [Ogataea philodendri]|uniref:tRNA-splicing endonuclease subunit Sen2 n=1 Tax=Ogataea philodendri TaxID=1378263 RepID=A0A9P8T6H9_9ASCO|nr:uncharacterized protein OGAPHI_003063 [Ogataea philodendri]KAH3667414.1 hypothetical protein OGAPHI_003063 [Ogataea philodendri]
MKRVKNSERYNNPLPVGFTAMSPLSWLVAAAVMTWQYWKHKPHVDAEFRVFGPDMKFLWDHGFFGKGVLSRSEPTWQDRTRRRVLGIEGPNADEEVVLQRRKARALFKQKRKQLDELENFYKRENDKKGLEEVALKKRELSVEKFQTDRLVRPEDHELVVGSDIVQLEYLQLMPEEVLFLQLLDAVTCDVDFVGLFRSLASVSFCQRFLVYYHYRTLGWVVKSGLKFSCDFILYERGPVFQHSQYAVKIAEPSSWVDVCSTSRVVGAVKKKLILVYVEPPSDFDALVGRLTSKQSIFKFLSEFSLDEVLIKRWSASRGRD